MRIFAIMMLAVCLLPRTLIGGEYKEVVSSFDNDLYKIDTKNILIRTENCMEDVRSQQVLARINGRSGEMVFSESGNRCRIRAVYGSSGYRVGNYRVDITREDENWYKITDQEIYIRTEDCLIYAFGQEGILSVSTVAKSGGGSLHFDREACRVTGLYSPMNL